MNLVNWTSLKALIKHEIKYLPMWYVLASSIQLCIQMISNWDLGVVGVADNPHEFFPLGIGVVMTVIFPILWVVIYAFCRVIATKNKALKELEEGRKKEGVNP